MLGLIDSTGTEVVKYTYDAWGKVLSTTGSLASTLGTIQPFRYRGYVYDVETGLYYLRARYYNPTWNRFINADMLIKDNLFAYCSNNSVNKLDPDGLIEKLDETNYSTIGREIDLFALIKDQTKILGDVIDFLAEQKRIIDNPKIKYHWGSSSDSKGYDCATFISASLQKISTVKGRNGYIKSETGITSMLKNKRNCFLFIAQLEDYALNEIPIGAIFLRPVGFVKGEPGHGATFAERISDNSLIIYQAANSDDGIIQTTLTYEELCLQYKFFAWPNGLGTNENPPVW